MIFDNIYDQYLSSWNIFFFLSFALNLEYYTLRDGLWTLHTHVRKKRKANEPGFWTFLPRSYTFSPANVRSRFDGILSSFFFCALVMSLVPYLIFNILLPLNFFQFYLYMWIYSKLIYIYIYWLQWKFLF